MILTLSACRTQTLTELKEIHDTVNIVKRDTIEKVKTQYKNVYLFKKDSTEVNRYAKNDTVYVEKTRWKTDIQYVYLERQDSTKEVKNDSTYRSKNNINNSEVIKEKKSLIEKVKEELGGLILYALIFLGCIILLKNTKIKHKL